MATNAELCRQQRDEQFLKISAILNTFRAQDGAEKARNWDTLPLFDLY